MFFFSHEMDSFFVSTPGPQGSTGVLKEEAYGAAITRYYETANQSE